MELFAIRGRWASVDRMADHRRNRCLRFSSDSRSQSFFYFHQMTHSVQKPRFSTALMRQDRTSAILSWK
jgi:hypothetical protein